MILHKSPSCYFISHEDEISYSSSDTLQTYKLDPDLFQINKPFVTSERTTETLDSATQKLKTIYEEEVKPFYDTLLDNSEDKDNAKAIAAAKRFFCEEEPAFEKFHGANPTESPVIAEFHGKQVLFPWKCRFFNCDLFGEVEVGERYDLIVVDPPWKNKFIKRRRGSVMGYDTHSTEAIEKLQVDKMLSGDGVVAVWATNGKTEELINKILSKWGLTYLTTFYWLKVTRKGQLTCPFTKPNGKQPYESLILASSSEPPPQLKQTRLIVSTPSAINSHKPPLTQVLEDFFHRKFPSKCELFARYLLPEYTSYGNQVLKMNSLSLFRSS